MNSSTMYRFTPHPLVSIVFIVAFIFLYFNSSPLLFDPDVGWHLAAGKLILDTKEIPFHDPWSFTMEQHPDYAWYNISWLWDVLIAFIADIAGEGGLYVFSIAFVAFILAFLAHSLLSRKIFHEDAVKIIVTLAGLVLWHSMFARPQLITYFFALLFHHLLYKNQKSQHSLVPLGILPLLMVIWGNCHGGFLAGFTVIGAYMIEAYREKQRRYTKTLFLSGILCGFALFLNPYGIYVFDGVLRSLNSEFTSYIGEWHSFAYGEFLGLSIYILVFLLCSNLREKNIPISEKILTFAWLFAALFSIRNFAVFALLAAPYMAYNLQHTLHFREHKPYNTPLKQAGIFAIACIIVVLFFSPKHRHIVTLDDIVIDASRVPVAAVDFINEHYSDKRFMNHYDLGGYLIYLAPNLKVFVDGRAGTAYSEDVLQEVIRFFFFENGWKDLIKKYHIDGIILPGKYKSNTILMEDPDWVRVFESEAANVYVRKGISSKS